MTREAMVQTNCAITKCYPSQMRQFHDFTLLYTPFEQFLQCRTANELYDVCSLPQRQPMYLNNNNSSQTCLLQSNTHLYSLNINQSSLNLIEINPLNQQQFRSQCVQINNNFAYLTTNTLNIHSLNPQQDMKQIPISQHDLIKFQQNGYTLSPLISKSQSLLSLTVYPQTNEVTEIELVKGRVHDYRSFLPKSLSNILSVDDNLVCVWGTNEAVLVDRRMERQAMIMQTDKKVGQIKMKNQILFAAIDHQIVELDLRKDQLGGHPFIRHRECIEQFTLTNQHSFIRPLYSSQVLIFAPQ